MRIRTLGAALAGLVLVSTSCSESGTVAPGLMTAPTLAAIAAPEVRISEIHYDNAGTDAGEAIEVSFPGGTDLTGYKVVLYNGSGGAVYGSEALLTGRTITACGTRGLVVITYPVDGLQNGAPDGMALVAPGGTVVEFLSYEGTFTAVGGAAGGMSSTDIGIAETSTTPLGHSLQRSAGNTWTAAASTFGACNVNEADAPAVVASVTVAPATASMVVGGSQQLTATARDAGGALVPGATVTWSSSAPAVATVSTTGLVTAVAPGDAQITATATNGVAGSAAVHVDPVPTGIPDVKFSEIHYDNDGADVGEAIEVEGPAGTNLSGWSLVLYNGSNNAPYNTKTLSGIIPAQCDGRGTLHFTYPPDGIQNGAPDGMALVAPGGTVVEFLSYEGTMTAVSGPAAGRTSTDIGVSESASASASRSLARIGTSWLSRLQSFGQCNPVGPEKTIFFSGRTPGDPALPVGFEDQIFADYEVDGVEVPTTITWVSETPLIASIDQDGVIRALAAGTAIFRATASDGFTRTWSLPTTVATPSATAQYGHNVEFGIPADADMADDFHIVRAQYTSSFSIARGIPNWVSYNIDATHFGALDRCDCFTYDPELPDAGTYTTADYTGAATVHGYGIDRGHLARSFDRTSGALDNAHTFYFSNIIPQASDNNQGPWAALETYLGDKARLESREVFVIAGASGSRGTVKNEGRITIPAHTWKVALVLPRDQGLASVDELSDLVEVVAVVMPNTAGIRNVSWQSYRVTVDSVEKLSGYDLLKLLRDDLEIAIESGTHFPVAVVDGPYASIEGEAVAMSAAASSDADAGQSLAYAWSFGDGSTAAGATTSHTYAAAGTYTVRVIVTDPLGLADTATTTASVITRAQATANASALVAALVTSGKLNAGEANSVIVKLAAAHSLFERGNLTAAVKTLQAALHELDALEASGRLGRPDTAALRDLLGRIIHSVS